MKLFISADIEGTCGIVAWPETERSTMEDYRPYQAQMNREVRAACNGALDGGATEILVKDAHDSARNLDPSLMPRPVQMLRGWPGDPLSMMSGLNQDNFDAVAFTGFHAEAGNPGNPLSHISNLGNEYVMLNGVRASEFLVNAYTAGYYKVPVVFLSGDQAICDFAKNLIPNITTVAVNRGQGGGVRALHPDVAAEAIYDGMKQALGKAEQCHVTLPQHFETTIRFREHKVAYARSFYPGATLSDGKNVDFSSDDWFEILRFYRFVLSN